MTDLERIKAQLARQHSLLRRNMDHAYQGDVLKAEETHAQNMYFIEQVREQLGNNNDNLADWLPIARQVAHELVITEPLGRPLFEDDLYKQFVAVAESGIAAFHAARRELGLSEKP